MIWVYGKTELEVSQGANGGTRVVTREHLGDMDGKPDCPVEVPPLDLVGIAVQLFEACGQPAPVITPRPNIDTSHPTPYEGITLSAEPDRVVRIAMDGGCVFRELEPHAARVLAGALVAYADAVESEPDPADVERLAQMIEQGGEGSTVHPHGRVTVHSDTLARHLLRSGVRLPGEGGDGA